MEMLGLRAAVGVGDGVGVLVFVAVGVGDGEGVAVPVAVGVGVGVGVLVAVAVGVGVSVGALTRDIYTTLEVAHSLPLALPPLPR